MESEKVTYDRALVVEVLRDLNVLVVSVDRLWADPHIDRESDEQFNALFVKSLIELKFFQRIAKARMLLSDAFSYEVGEDGMDELEREFQDLKYWPEIEPFNDPLAETDT